MSQKGMLRKRFTSQEILDAMEVNSGDLTLAAGDLSLLRGVPVSRQNLAYWVRNLTEVTKVNGEPYIGTTVLDRKIRNEELVLRARSEDDDLPVGGMRQPDNSCVLVINDTHAPYHHPDTMDFLKAVKDKYVPTRVICGGDEVDNHALSFHDSDPNLDSAGPELYKARLFLAQLARLFPVMDVCHSNHGSLVYRKAFKAGIPAECIKSYREILFGKTDTGYGWGWYEEVRLQLPNGEELQVQHQGNGNYLAIAAHERCNLVLAHEHSKFKIEYAASKAAMYFGMYAGCLIDKDAMAFAYGKLAKNRPIVGVGIIKDSLPQLVPMLLDRAGRWTGSLGE